MPDFEPRHRDLVSLLADSVTRFANRPLFGTKRGGAWQWITYGEFNTLVDRCRGALSAAGVEAGDRVAIISNNREEWAVGAYASYGLGAAWVPMYESQQEKEWQFILADSGAKVIFVANAGIAGRIRALQPTLPALTRVVVLDAAPEEHDGWASLLAEGDKHLVPAKAPDPSSIAGYIYTAGTTGRPKGVLLTHSNIASNVYSALAIFPIGPENRSLSFLPWAHSFGHTAELHTLICAGASIAICEGIPKLLDNLVEVRPSVLMAVPNVFNRLYAKVMEQLSDEPRPVQALFHTAMRAQSKLKRGEHVRSSERVALAIGKRFAFRKIAARFGGRLQFAISGGAALAPEVAEFVDNLGILVCEGYGLTETSPIVAANSPTVRRIGTVGKPLPGVRITIDESVSTTEGEGEVVVYGHNVMRGYHHLPEENEKVLTPDGGLRTGDLGRLDREGFLTITGRLKELYKLENGKYVAPAALEQHLQLSPYIQQAFVYGANRPANVAILVPAWEAVREWAREHGVSGTSPDVLAANPKVRELIAEEIRQQSTGWKGFEAIREFLLATEEFSIANDLLTPKLSTKRANVVKRYAKEIEAMYAGLRDEAARARVPPAPPPPQRPEIRPESY